jgi:hypothetical protein
LGAEVEAEIREASMVAPPTVEETAALFDDLSYMWEVATPEERRRLIGPLIERFYVDMESGHWYPQHRFGCCSSARCGRRTQRSS